MRSVGKILALGLIGGPLVVAVGLLTLFGTPSGFAPPRDRSLDHWQQRWSAVLEARVDTKGRVDFAGLEGDRAGLTEVVRFIAAIDPESSPADFPTPESRLAYYIDAYNALAMYGVLEAGVPERFGWFGRIRFFLLRKFAMGGRSLSLYWLENKIIRPLGDPRVHFALNCMSVGCPRLPRSAFTAQELDRQLDAAALEFVADPDKVTVDDARKQTRISSIFKFYTEDFLKRAPSLLDYVNQYRVAKIPMDYKIVFLEYDWTINDQRGATR